MTVAAVLQAVRDRFDAMVATPLDLRTIHDNAPEPADPRATWCRFVVDLVSADQLTVGRVLVRSTGLATAQLFVPVARGDGVALDLAQAVIDVFRGATISSPAIRFTPAPSLVGPSELSGGWVARTVRIPFRSDEVA